MRMIRITNLPDICHSLEKWQNRDIHNPFNPNIIGAALVQRPTGKQAQDALDLFHRLSDDIDKAVFTLSAYLHTKGILDRLETNNNKAQDE